MKGSSLPKFILSDGLKKYLPEYGNEPARWCAGDKFQSTEQGFNGPLPDLMPQPHRCQRSAVCDICKV